ncbi:MAG: hypothetical protein IJL03_07875 [Lachnospiraceae bacterium]|nr:hypothetical protein [Clostridia bacterium]MBQ6105851.1 hypothetical protein [Lachnospiraceae bacterium]
MANLIADSVRMTEEQWNQCKEMAKIMHLRSKNEFIRDAVDFYIEWCRRPYSQQFLTAALESVISAKIRESESRICRMLFKNAVEQNVSTRLAAWDYDLSDKQLDSLYRISVAEVKKNNGALDLEKYFELSEEEQASWQD